MNAGVVEICLFSGVVAHVSPLSPQTISAIVERAKTVHPDPDETPYIKPVENSAIEGDTYVDRDDPQYRAELMIVSSKRAELQNYLMFDFAMAFPEGRDALAQRFTGRLDRMRDHGLELYADEWRNVLIHCIMTRQSDWEAVRKIATDRMPLTEEEITNGMRIFRPALSQYERAPMAANEPSGAGQ